MFKVARVQRTASAWAFLIGAVLLLLLLLLVPDRPRIHHELPKALYGGGNTWAGFANYVRIFHDPTFWQAWRNTLEFTSWRSSSATPCRSAWRSCSTSCGTPALPAGAGLPAVMLPPATALVLFSYFYNPQYGLFDRIPALHCLPGSQWCSRPATASSASR